MLAVARPHGPRWRESYTTKRDPKVIHGCVSHTPMCGQPLGKGILTHLVRRLLSRTIASLVLRVVQSKHLRLKQSIARRAAKLTTVVEPVRKMRLFPARLPFCQACLRYWYENLPVPKYIMSC
jgi:hypothetical protein